MSEMITHNRAELAAAIKAVPHDEASTIEARTAQDKLLCKYTFHGAAAYTAEQYDRHLRRIARNVLNTPAAIWR